MDRCQSRGQRGRRVGLDGDGRIGRALCRCRFLGRGLLLVLLRWCWGGGARTEKGSRLLFGCPLRVALVNGTAGRDLYCTYSMYLGTSTAAGRYSGRDSSPGVILAGRRVSPARASELWRTAALKWRGTTRYDYGPHERAESQTTPSDASTSCRSFEELSNIPIIGPGHEGLTSRLSIVRMMA